VLAAGGLLLLSRVPAHGSYLRDMLPGMLMAGFALGMSSTSIGVGILTDAQQDEAGMISGASATGHELGGTLGIAIYASIATAASNGIFAGPTAAAGIAQAFLIAAHVALGAAAATIVLLPAAKTFLPKLRLNPHAIAAHQQAPTRARYAAQPLEGESPLPGGLILDRRATGSARPGATRRRAGASSAAAPARRHCPPTPRR
jgi:hypothetical protein